jgi:hypothetical protein
MNGRHEGELSEHWDSDSDDWDDDVVDEDVEETRDKIDRNRPAEAFARSNRTIVHTAEEAIARADKVLAGIDPDTDRPFEESFYDANEFRPDEDSPRIKESDKEVEGILDMTKNDEKEKKKSAKRRWLFISIGILITGGTAFGAYELVRRRMKGEGADDIPIPDDVRKAVEDLVTKWKTEPDATFWNDFAAAIDTGLVVGGKAQEFTIADQIVFLNFTIEVNPLKDLWVWDHTQDILDNAEAIKKIYDTGKKISDIYRHVVEVKGKNGGGLQVMPRAIAAAQLKLVLGWISADKH